MIKGTVALIGRPNVGKSTLFNRLTRSRNAIVDDQPGITRDRLYGVAQCTEPTDHWESYLVVDTGGFEKDDFNFQPFQENLVWQQTEQAIKDANVIVMVFDGKEGPTPHDKELVNFLRGLNKPVIYAVNKVDGIEQRHTAWPFYELGIDIHIEVSAAHNRYVYELSELIEAELAKCPSLTRKERNVNECHITIIGRPNVGKSSLLNRLAGENRALVSDIAGTTRDCVDIDLTYNGKKYVVIDTAGIRRKTKINDKIESLTVMRSIQGIERADLTLLVIGPEGLTDQDARLAGLAISRFKPLLIIVNKWDLVTEKDANTAEELRKDIHAKIGNTKYVPVTFISCLTNQRVHKVLQQVELMMTDYHKRVTTSEINDCLQSIVRHHTPALINSSNKRIKFYYATQVKAAPPTIVVKCNVSEEIQESYKRYMNHQFRRRLDFGTAPIRLLFRPKTRREERAELLTGTQGGN